MFKKNNSKKTNKKRKKIPFIYKIFACILSLITLILIGSIIYLNILSLPLLILLIIFILIFSSISILLMLKSRKKKTGFGITLILIILFSILIFYINKTTGLLTNLNLNYKTYNYSVVVLKDSSYKKLKDINGLNLGYYDDGTPETEKAKDKVLKKVELTPADYEDSHTLANSLLDKDVEAILIEDSYLDILDESIEYEGKTFKECIRKIYSFVIVTNTNDIAKDINVTKEPFNIYVSGIDTYGEISSVSRSDVNMIISVNPSTRQILLTSIPRDYYVQLHGKSGYKDKLTHAGLYGIDMSIQTLEDLLDIEINYYVKVNFSSVINIIDAIGGITVYSDYTFTSIDNYNYTKGYNNVNGEQALSFARERKSFATGDRQRVKNQQAVFKAVFDKCTSKAIITKYSKLLDSLHGSFVTNMPTSRLTSLIRLQLSKNYNWNIVTNSLEGSDGSNYTYSAPSQKVYVMVPKEESVLYAQELINKVLEGEILDEELMDEVSNQVHEVTKNNPSYSTTTDNTTDTTTSTKEESTSEDSSINKEGLVVKLVKSSIVFTEGDDYTYNGYTATYNGKDITNSSQLIEKWSINNQNFTEYTELVYYISKELKPGSYTITFTITYNNETKTLKQNITKEPMEESKEETTDEEELTDDQNEDTKKTDDIE